jgi:hypothetical protein
MNSQTEVRQFTLACELVFTGVGVWVVSELDAVNYQKLELYFAHLCLVCRMGCFGAANFEKTLLGQVGIYGAF